MNISTIFVTISIFEKMVTPTLILILSTTKWDGQLLRWFVFSNWLTHHELSQVLRRSKYKCPMEESESVSSPQQTKLVTTGHSVLYLWMYMEPSRYISSWFPLNILCLARIKRFWKLSTAEGHCRELLSQQSSVSWIRNITYIQ